MESKPLNGLLALYDTGGMASLKIYSGGVNSVDKDPQKLMYVLGKELISEQPSLEYNTFLFVLVFCKHRIFHAVHSNVVHFYMVYYKIEYNFISIIHKRTFL